jgi:dual specificity tyrosine-phosphorylation-regulated kinase 2/3/4
MLRSEEPRPRREVHPISPVVRDSPITPEQAKRQYYSLLTGYEMEEITSFPEIYYLGQPAIKIRPRNTGGDNRGFDDNLHHYRVQIGDHIAYRFEVRSQYGKGAFGQVIQCFDHKNKIFVALKIMVNTEQMHSQGRMEVGLTQRLNESPGFDHSHIVKGLDYFFFRQHICVAFEALGSNLYEYHRSINYRSLGRDQLKSIAKGILKGLAFMHSCFIVHCDLKPENILLLPNSTTEIRLIDFGSSCLIGHQQFEYIQSRYYRAPEVMLGIPYGPPMDMWSFGCILAEMMVGHPIFQGDDEEEQMQILIEVLGIPPEEIIEISHRRRFFFTDNGFPLPPAKPRQRLGRSIRAVTRMRDLLLLDLIERCLEWDQRKRITAVEALHHPWFDSKDLSDVRNSYLAMPVECHHHALPFREGAEAWRTE